MSDEQIAQAMLFLGGHFIQQLGRLWWVADADNRRRLKAAFSEYFEQYKELAELKAGRTTDAAEVREA